MQEINTTTKDIKLISEILNFKQDIFCINRDGDLCFVECPNCHSTDLNKPHMFMCRDCGTFFYMYTEDGIKTFYDVKTYCRIANENENIILVLDKQEEYYIPYIRELEQFKKELGDNYDSEIILYKDLTKEGKDCHGHGKYQEYILIKK